jgi:hypothetical protein
MENTMSEVLSVRLPAGTVKNLKLLACRLSLEQNREIRWTTLLKQAIDRLLQDEGSEPIYGLPVIRRGSPDAE